MKKSFVRKLFVLVLTFCLVFTSAIASFAASAPAKPGKVSITSAKAKSTTQIVLKWKKITKNCKGYQIYRNGKKIKTIKVLQKLKSLQKQAAQFHLLLHHPHHHRFSQLQ